MHPCQEHPIFSSGGKEKSCSGNFYLEKEKGLSVGKDVEQLKFLHTAGERGSSYNHFRKSAVSTKCKHTTML